MKDIPPVGSVVRLRSGGAKMTVFELLESDWVECVWMNTGKFEKKRCHVSMLDPAPSDLEEFGPVPQ